MRRQWRGGRDVEGMRAKRQKRFSARDPPKKNRRCPTSPVSLFPLCLSPSPNHMARTKQTAGRSTGGSAPRKSLAAKSLVTGSRTSPTSKLDAAPRTTRATRKTAPEPEAGLRQKAEPASTTRKATKTKTPKKAVEPEPNPSEPALRSVSLSTSPAHLRIEG